MWLMTPTKTRPHKPMLAEWTSEILSLDAARSVDNLLPSRSSNRLSGDGCPIVIVAGT